MSERDAIVVWLRGNPFPWMKRTSTLGDRLRAAWSILFGGEQTMRGFCSMLAYKLENGEHMKGSGDE